MMDYFNQDKRYGSNKNLIVLNFKLKRLIEQKGHLVPNVYVGFSNT